MVKPPDINLEFLSGIQLAFSTLYKANRLEVSNVRKVCGVDVAYSENKAYAASVLWDPRSDRILEKMSIREEIAFPYISTFLFLREGPIALRAVRKLSMRPDLILVDGHGIAHPRRAGLAVFVGVLLDLPSVGVAKSLLVGELGKKVGGFAPIYVQDSMVGFQVHRKDRASFYASPGHRVRVEDLKALIRLMGNAYPKPLREAHNLAVREQREEFKG